MVASIKTGFTHFLCTVLLSLGLFSFAHSATSLEEHINEIQLNVTEIIANKKLSHPEKIAAYAQLTTDINDLLSQYAEDQKAQEQLFSLLQLIQEHQDIIGGKGGKLGFLSHYKWPVLTLTAATAIVAGCIIFSQRAKRAEDETARDLIVRETREKAEQLAREQQAAQKAEVDRLERQRLEKEKSEHEAKDKEAKDKEAKEKKALEDKKAQEAKEAKDKAEREAAEAKAKKEKEEADKAAQLALAQKQADEAAAKLKAEEADRLEREAQQRAQREEQETRAKQEELARLEQEKLEREKAELLAREQEATRKAEVERLERERVEKEKSEHEAKERFKKELAEFQKLTGVEYHPEHRKSDTYSTYEWSVKNLAEEIGKAFFDKYLKETGIPCYEKGKCDCVVESMKKLDDFLSKDSIKKMFVHYVKTAMQIEQPAEQKQGKGKQITVETLIINHIQNTVSKLVTHQSTYHGYPAKSHNDWIRDYIPKTLIELVNKEERLTSDAMRGFVLKLAPIMLFSSKEKLSIAADIMLKEFNVAEMDKATRENLIEGLWRCVKYFTCEGIQDIDELDRSYKVVKRKLDKLPLPSKK